MDFLQQFQGGKLNNMLQQVGIDDVGSFVSQFRNQAHNEAGRAHEEDEDEEEEEYGGSAAGGNASLNQVY
jgi:hypothetical protein